MKIAISTTPMVALRLVRMAWVKRRSAVAAARPGRRQRAGLRGQWPGRGDGNGHGYPAVLVRGSRIAVAMSDSKIATSTATVMIEEQPLHERVVVVPDGVQQAIPDALVVEDVLDQDRAADHESERHGEASEVRQDRVACPVVDHDRERRQALSPGHPDVVLGERGHHVVPHGEDPSADARDQQGQRRQDRVDQHVADIARRERGGPRAGRRCRRPAATRGDAEDEDQHHADPEERDSGGEDEQWRQ